MNEDGFFQKFAYFVLPVALGGLSALASLLGDTGKALECRTFVAYVLSGGLVGLGVVLLAVEKLGESPFLIALSIFSGYKAFDLLAIASVAAQTMARRWLGVPGEGGEVEGKEEASKND